MSEEEYCVLFRFVLSSTPAALKLQVERDVLERC